MNLSICHIKPGTKIFQVIKVKNIPIIEYYNLQ